MATLHTDTASPRAPPSPRIGPMAEQSSAETITVMDEKSLRVEGEKNGFFSSSASASEVAAADASDALRSGADSVTLMKAKKGDAYEPVWGTKFEHNIYRAIGFLELANAGDFAANLWNKTPIPIYAMVFMALGGTCAGIMSIFAFMDCRLAYRNVCFLRWQRHALKAERARRLQNSQSVRDLDVLLAVSFRELGGEMINRWVLDMFMGVGAVLICVGTYMAMDSANHNVWFVSNILSGYLGNAPIALFGICNFYWAIFIFCKSQGHVNAATQLIPGTYASALIKRRTRNMQIFCALNGTATLMGGVGSMMTATMWYGYFVLIPVIIASIFCNFWWRRMIGYTRCDLLVAEMNADELATALEFAAQAEIIIREHMAAPINPFITDPTSLHCVITFLQEHELLDQFCVRLTAEPDLHASVCSSSKDATKVTIHLPALLAVPEKLHPAMIKVAQDMVRQVGPKHFKYRERYAAELLGTYLYLSRHDTSCNGEAERQGEKLTLG